MAYVGTPSRLGDPVRTLASVLQGEASSAAGQTAVANVIANRADANYGRYGSDPLSQALGRNQFQGQATPTAQSLAIAQQLYDGTLPRTLTNSLNYAAPVYSGPGATTARWAINALNSGQGVNIGGNVFFQNDRGGTPTYNPAATGGAAANANAPAAGSGASAPQPQYSGDAGDGTITGMSTNADGSANVTLGGGDGADAAGGAAGGLGGLTSGQFPGLGGLLGMAGSMLGLPSGVTSAITGALGLGGSATAAAGGGNISGFNAAGPVQASPGLVTATNQVATATREGDRAITQGVQTAGQTIGQAITSQSQSWQSLFSDTFVRFAFIITGLVLFGAALMYFARPQLEAVARATPIGKLIPK